MQCAAEFPLHLMRIAPLTSEPPAARLSCAAAIPARTADEPGVSTARSPTGVWQRRVVGPLRGLLTRGLTPDRIAATVATGAVCSLCPLVGTTTALNVAAGVWLRMNHPLLQTLNNVFWPLQLLMIVPYVRFGGWMFGGHGEAFTRAEIMRIVQEATFAESLGKLGLAGVHGLLAWLITAPLLFALAYAPVRAITRVRRLTGVRE
jgi:uncharacterized protein (DUF2062 family)